MIIDGKKFASMCDVGNMNVWATKADMKYVVDLAKRYGCCSVYGLKCWAPYMAELLKGSGINLEFSICNNAGSDDIEVKKFGAKRYVELGLTEVETYLNFSYLKSGMYKECLADVRAIRDAIPEGMVYKVIIQTPILTDDEIRTACEICVDGGATFVKTGNMEYGRTTVHAVEVIAETLKGRAQIKATPPFANIDEIYKYLDLGVTRFGIGADQLVYLVNEANYRVYGK